MGESNSKIMHKQENNSNNCYEENKTWKWEREVLGNFFSVASEGSFSEEWVE